MMISTYDIYTEHFGLRERPFSLVPDPGFMFWSAHHKHAYAMLEYGLMTRAPITLITGEVGAGKTTLLYHLLKSVPEDLRVGLVSNAHGDRGELLRWVLMALSQPVPPNTDYVDLFAQFQTYLIAEYAAGRRVILIFDEAQNLSCSALEELRMFTNINSNKDELLQLVLVGQPELRDIVLRPELRQFAQRVAASYHLPTMDAKMVRKYVTHRLQVAGADRWIFSGAALQLVYQATRGVPRLVNQLCDLAMVYAYSKDRRTVQRATVQQVLDDGAFFGGGAPSALAADPVVVLRPEARTDIRPELRAELRPELRADYRLEYRTEPRPENRGGGGKLAQARLLGPVTDQSHKTE
jgi:general secretion pathway protein A